jgi:undecaprenyl diphosphate synthase
MKPPFEHSIEHVAFIMDGNGRWAQSRSHSRVWGHLRGAAIISGLLDESDRLGVKQVTMFSFSTENWSRPISEIDTLFKILKKFLIRERNRIIRKNVKFRVIGCIERLPKETKKLIVDLEDATSDNTGLKFNVAFDYGSRKELVDATNRHLTDNPGVPFTEEMLETYLYEGNHRDVDLLIRTGGEQRLSNFLLWQLAYAELYFTSTKWPDFTKVEYEKILREVSKRERRFGFVTGTNDQDEIVKLSEENRKFMEEQVNLNAFD